MAKDINNQNTDIDILSLTKNQITSQTYEEIYI